MLGRSTIESVRQNVWAYKTVLITNPNVNCKLLLMSWIELYLVGFCYSGNLVYRSLWSLCQWKIHGCFRRDLHHTIEGSTDRFLMNEWTWSRLRAYACCNWYEYSKFHWRACRTVVPIMCLAAWLWWMLLWGFSCRSQCNFFHINCLCTSFYAICHKRVNSISLPYWNILTFLLLSIVNTDLQVNYNTDKTVIVHAVCLKWMPDITCSCTWSAHCLCRCCLTHSLTLNGKGDMDKRQPSPLNCCWTTWAKSFIVLGPMT